MIGLRNEGQLARRLPALEQERKLFAFLLYDSRSSHKSVPQYIQSHVEWLDQLAKATGMYFLCFLNQDAQDAEFQNGSLNVARSFGIVPSRLPGIVVFTSRLSSALSGSSVPLAGPPQKIEGVYLPVKAELFDQDPQKVEESIVDLFSIIQECSSMTKNEDELLPILKKRVQSFEDFQVVRPALHYLVTSGIQAVQAFGAEFTQSLRKALVPATVAAVMALLGAGH